MNGPITLRAAFVMGPTAAGKTDLAIRAAEALGAEIISCDSRQVYRWMNVGTASPTQAERARVPHHLIDIADPNERVSAGRWAEQAVAVLERLERTNTPALVVGGCGLYARALRRGLARLPSDEALRRELEGAWARLGAARSHARLAALDPDAARRIHPNNRQRVIRALEVCLVAGRPISDLWQQGTPGRGARFPAPLLVLDLPRSQRHARIDARVPAMFARGLLDEARALERLGMTAAWPSYRTLGYPEALECTRGAIGRDQAIEAVRHKTRAFARRQITWLKGEPDARWIALDRGEPDAERDAVAALLGAVEPTVLMPLDALSPAG